MNPALLLEIINEKKEYKIEEIRNYRKWGCNTQSLVYWKGYGNEHDEWIAKTGLPHTKKAVKNY